MASSITEAQTALINSLTPDDIPHKLRCANCSKLAVNAFRLPCCEQAICESCHSSLPSSCPVCEHSPLSAEDCTPNKSLRTTIRVFLRTAEKKREANKVKDVPEPASETPVEAAPVHSSDESQAVGADRASVNGARESTAAAGNPSTVTVPDVVQGETEHAQQQQEASDARREVPDVGNNVDEEDDDDSDDDVVITTKRPEQHPQDDEGVEEAEEDGQGEIGNGDGQVPHGNGFANQLFPGGGDFNQMQMMMAMQSNMGFPTMAGMPGMNMDPMMQNMFMNGGFQGMGMNGMGNYGGGYDNNWNGSQSWNFDQNNFNQNGAGMNTGDFGNFNSGFQTGYNQGNYGQYNNYRQHNYRGRGRGRGYYGGYGRGGFQQGGNYHGQGQMQQGQIDGTAQSFSQTSYQGDAHSVTQDKEGSQPADVPVNAPTGPKAMRQGLPNTSLHHLRARGYQVGDGAVEGSADGQSRSQCDDAERDIEGADRRSAQGNPDRDNSYAQSRATSRGHSRSRSRGDGSSRRRTRDRSQTADGDRHDDDSHSRSRKHRSRKHSSRHGDEEVQHEKGTVGGGERSRSASPEDGAKKSSRHSRRERDSDRHRDKDRHRGDEKSSSHRSHRDRDRDRDHDHSRRRDKDKDRDRDRERDRDRDRERRDRHRDRDRDRDRDKDRRERKDRNRDRDRDRESRYDRKHSTDGIPAPAEASNNGVGGGSSSTAKDPHTLEREARNRERLLKEAQRMASVGTGGGGGGVGSSGGTKRSRGGGGGGEDGTDSVGSRKGRRTTDGSRRSDAAPAVDRDRDGDDDRASSRRYD